MQRNIVSVIVGVVSAVLLFIFVENINSTVHPTSTQVYNDPSATPTAYANQPLTFWLIVLFGWVSGSMCCGFIIKRISKSENQKLPLIAGSLLTLSAIANFLALPHPTWFIVLGLILFIPSTWLGYKLYKLKTNG